MISWLPLTITSYLIFAFGGVLDKIIVGNKFKNPYIVSFWVSSLSITSFWILAVGLLPFEFAENFKFAAPSPFIMALSLGAGVIFQLGLLSMYIGLFKDEATRVISSIGAATAIFTLILAHYILGENLAPSSYLAFLLLILGIVVISIKQKAGLGPALLYSILSAFFFALQTVMAKFIYGQHQFITSLVLISAGGIFYTVLLPLFSTTVRSDIRNKFKRPKANGGKTKKTGQLKWIVFNSGLGAIGNLIFNFAIKLGPVSLVNALKGVQYAGIFIIAVMLKDKHPKLLNEELSGRSELQKLIAIVLIIAGIIVLAAPTSKVS